MGLFKDTVMRSLSESADKAAIEAFFTKFDVEDISTAQQATDFIMKNSVLRSGLDSYVTKAVTEHDKRFQADKLPGILEEERKKLQTELNPPKTEAEKRLAEMEKTLTDMRTKEAQSKLEKHLRGKAKELGYPEDRAERFAVYGEKAEDMLGAEAEFYKSHIESGVEAEIKKRFGNAKPPQKSQGNPEKAKSRAEFFSMDAEAQSKFVADGGYVVDS